MKPDDLLSPEDPRVEHRLLDLDTAVLPVAYWRPETKTVSSLTCTNSSARTRPSHCERNSLTQRPNSSTRCHGEPV
jgi:hypothetical protein